MKNEYDRDDFFHEYAQMPRSRQGLEAAGEWHQLQPLFPSLQGKRVLDLGCGYGGTAGTLPSRALRRFWVLT